MARIRFLSKWSLAFLVFSALLGACGILPLVGLGQPPDRDPNTPGNEPTRGFAEVQSIDIRILESFPVQVEVVASGYLPDSCTQIERVLTERKGRSFQTTILTIRDADLACAQAVFPFEEVIALDVFGLEAGVYEVDVNGVRDIFTLPAQNEPVLNNSALSGRVWHDECAVGGGEGGAPVVPTAGCISKSGGGYQANGIMEGSERTIGGILVNLGVGACPATGLASTVTGIDGSFAFRDLSPGTYCVSIDPLEGQNVTTLVPGDWTAPAESVGVARMTVTLQAEEDRRDLNFGWDYQFLPVPPQVATPTPTVVPPTPTATPPPTRCDWAQFVKDVDVMDGDVFVPGANFIKTWRLKNIGTCSWTTDYDLVFVSGDRMDAEKTVPLRTTVRPGETVDISLKLIAPNKPGDYRGYWQLRNASDVLFGIGDKASGSFWVDIEVKEVLRRDAYNFASSYCEAEWSSPAGALPCPGVEGDPKGFVIYSEAIALENRFENEPTIWVHPNDVTDGSAPDGSIRGIYPVINIKSGDRFRGWVGCLDGSVGCNILFRLGYISGEGRVINLGEWHEAYEGKVTVIDLDLSSLAGKKVQFVLTAISDGVNTDKADGFWFMPRISRVRGD